MPARMTHRERVLAAVDRQETDRTPIDFGGTLATTIVPTTYKKLKHLLGDTHPTTIGWKRQQLVLPAETILRRFDVDTRPLKLGDYDEGKARVIATHQMIDNWGTTWSKEAGGHYLNVDGPFYDSEPDPTLIEAYDNMDPAKLKADFGDRLAFWGGIDTQDILPFRTPTEVGEHVHYIIKTLGKGGGYVLSTVHNIQEQVPPENIVAMFEACLENRAEDRFENTPGKVVQRLQ